MIFKIVIVSRLFAMIILSVITAIIVRRRVRELSIILVFPFIFVLIHIPLWTESRYLLPIVPFLCILSAYSIYLSVKIIISRMKRIEFMK